MRGFRFISSFLSLLFKHEKLNLSKIIPGNATYAVSISFYAVVITGGVESGYSRAGFRVQEIGSNTVRGCDDSFPHTRVLDLSLQGGEAL